MVKEIKKQKKSTKVKGSTLTKKATKKTDKKKGFTLVELIAVIVLLAIILTIAGLSFSSIRLSAKERQYTNLVSQMRVQAKKYASETKIKKVYVDTLVNEGYVLGTGTKEIGTEGNRYIKQVVVNPMDQSKDLNCYMFDLELDDSEKEQFTEPEGALDENGECSKKILEEYMIDVLYCVGETCEDSNYGKLSEIEWIKGSPIYLKAVQTDNKKAREIFGEEEWEDVTYTWISRSLSPDMIITGQKYEGTSSGYINAPYEITAT